MSNQPDSLGNTGDGSEKKGHPPGLYLLFVVEMWERFSYYGMRALLVLYLIALTSHQIHLASSTAVVGTAGSPSGTGPLDAVTTGAAIDTVTDQNPGRGWSETDAYVLYGWYAGLAYLLPMVGGLLADRFLGTHRSMVLGGLLIALGHVVLAVTGFGSLPTTTEGMSTFISGLALIIIGTGFFKPCVSVMVGQLYPQKDARRDGAYTIFYMGVNLGAFICPFVCGTLGEQVGWHWGFGAAAVGMVAGLATYVIYRERYLKGIGLPPEKSTMMSPIVLGVISLVAAALVGLAYQVGVFASIQNGFDAMMKQPILSIAVPSTLVLLILAAATVFVLLQDKGDKGPTTSIFIFMIFNAFFWIAFEQAGSTLNVFADKSTDRNLFGWTVPATWFQSINAGGILLMAPFFAWLWTVLGRRNMNPSQPVKISLGLLFLGAGYVLIVLAAMFSSAGVLVSMFWLVGLYGLHTVGELCLSPTGLSFVNKVAPKRYISLLVGIWFVSNFMANLGGGLVATSVKKIESGELSLPWYAWFRLGGRADYFLLFVISSLGAGLLILALSPLLKMLYKGRE
jgi:POT family proton-dependent oligopeptide transporter